MLKVIYLIINNKQGLIIIVYSKENFFLRFNTFSV